MRPSTLLAVFATSAVAETVVPMLCHNTISSDVFVGIVLAGGDRVDWISDGAWALNTRSLDGFKCMVDGRNIRDYDFGGEVARRHELQLLCRKWYQNDWTGFIRSVKVRVGGGKRPEVIDEDNTDVGINFFTGRIRRYCMVSKLVSVA
ncbi:hypothetical protein L249_2823 [Ophiocordyceps polyrhachis-furcata BCC 54312]|uniref:Uncharacterized protein n=1 Tax=Ophiocordyceps polyrhachis-furcata BCC 54312 TaxID=1330021 RepID=A0A367LPJ6_9HYPO|nr:hypothetical protein L249_2823 [Ophiocordyceps polyrhachis-furcata BCC 54312]